MAEDTKESTPSQQASDQGKKPVPPSVPTAGPPSAAPPAPLPQKTAAAPPRPAAPPPPPPPRPSPKERGRRTFVKALLAVGAVLSMTPFVPWGNFLQGTIKTGQASRVLAQPLVVDDIRSKYGAAAGKQVNVNDLATFPPNSHWVFTYPTSGDPTVDANNPDTFSKFELIRLPSESPFNGGSKKATDFVAFSKVCVHLWCSPNYNPNQGHMQFECPCHGSIYRIPDGLSVAGPASIQAFPQNAIPMLTLLADSAGNMYVFYPNADPAKTTVSGGKPSIVSVDSIEGDGDIGYGRDYMSYENFIKPAAEQPLNPQDKDVPI